MPAKSKAQLRMAYAKAAQGVPWAKEMVAKTPRSEQSKLMKSKQAKKKKGK